MKLTVVICTGLLALFAIPCYADTEFHGVVETFTREVAIDSIITTYDGGAKDTLVTTGWGGPPATTDTFDFPDQPSWPTDVQLYFRVDGGLTRGQSLGFPMPGVWFTLLDSTGRVMFYAQSGIESPGSGLPSAVLAVEPSVLSSRVRFGFAGNGTAGKLVIYDAAGNCVRTFTTGRDAWTATWAGDDDIGSQLPNGAYFCRLTAGPAAATAKVLVAR